MNERRYTEEETTAIFRVAAEGPSAPLRPVSPTDGLTLAVRQGGASRTLLGLPIGVERRVTLNRRLTTEEWEHLVVQLRDVFQARGRIKSEGSLRQWTNGNLYVLLEPTPTGDRLRLGSLHAGATASIRLGLVALGSLAFLGIANLFGGHVADLGTLSGLLAGGLLLIANGALRLPGWARLRGRQMEDLAARLALPSESRSLQEPTA